MCGYFLNLNLGQPLTAEPFCIYIILTCRLFVKRLLHFRQVQFAFSPRPSKVRLKYAGASLAHKKQASLSTRPKYKRKGLFVDKLVNSEELKDCVKDFVKNSGNLFDCVLESFNESLPLRLGDNGFRIGVGLLTLVFAGFAAAVAVARPDSRAFAAAEAALKVSVLVLGAGKQEGLVNIRAISAAMAAVRNSCAV